MSRIDWDRSLDYALSRYDAQFATDGICDGCGKDVFRDGCLEVDREVYVCEDCQDQARCEECDFYRVPAGHGWIVDECRCDQMVVTYDDMTDRNPEPWLPRDWEARR